MDILRPGVPLETAVPRVLLDSQLQPGRYVVELVVRTDTGVSDPARLLITVAAAPRPPAGVTLTPGAALSG
jgi:hypothetical protein